MTDKERVINRLLGKCICPKCHKKVDELNYCSKVDASQTFEVDDEGNPYYSVMDYGDHSNEKWYCPECNELLFTDEDKAIEFLKTK